jgi:Flp pilus assembly protein TadG
MKRRTDSRQKQRGVIVVEMAMVVPILAILLLGTVQFGLVLREHQIVQNAAREGARFSSQQLISVSSARAPTETEVRSLVRTYLRNENVTVSDADIAVERNYYLGASIGYCGSRVRVTHTTAPVVGSGIWGNFTYTAEAVFRNMSADPC